MRIAVLSGKGGTGKTLVSVNLAAVSKDSLYVDCDVEEPNGHLFFKPIDVKERDITVKLPLVDMDLCDGCKDCVNWCNFNALAYVNNELIIFEEICHSCGGCMLVCPQNALTEKDKAIGKVISGKSEDVEIKTGMMNTGEASGIPIIKSLLSDIDRENERDILIDCPPGSACIVMDSIRDADYCVLVAEPTVFGAHNLKMVYELVKLFDKKFGVVLNKTHGGIDPSEEFCKKNDIQIISRIPFDKELGLICSNGEIAARVDSDYRSLFTNLLEVIKEDVK